MNKPAFTTTEWKVCDEIESQDSGMTLRDYFAAKAMQSLITDDRCTLIPIADTAEGLASDAYVIADAMLKAREPASELAEETGG